MKEYGNKSIICQTGVYIYALVYKCEYYYLAIYLFRNYRQEHRSRCWAEMIYLQGLELELENMC